MKKAWFIVIAALATGACTYSTDGVGVSEASSTPSPSEGDRHRLAFVEAACGGCHAVEPPHLSPNPASPPFADIANRDGLTEATLLRWLTDAHNYPEVMDFDLDPPQVEEIADYILTLRNSDYVRPKD